MRNDSLDSLQEIAILWLKQNSSEMCPAVVDTGSSLFTGPSDKMDPLMKLLPVDPKCKNLDTLPTVNILIKGEDGVIRYPLTPREYNLQTMNDTTDDIDCELGFGSMDVPGRKWVIGDTFLRRYYSIYDDDEGRVGLVRSWHQGEENIPPAKNLIVGVAPDAEVKTVAAASMEVPAAAAVAGTVLSGFFAKEDQQEDKSSCAKPAGRADFL